MPALQDRVRVDARYRLTERPPRDSASGARTRGIFRGRRPGACTDLATVVDDRHPVWLIAPDARCGHPVGPASTVLPGRPADGGRPGVLGRTGQLRAMRFSSARRRAIRSEAGAARSPRAGHRLLEDVGESGLGDARDAGQVTEVDERP